MKKTSNQKVMTKEGAKWEGGNCACSMYIKNRNNAS